MRFYTDENFPLPVVVELRRFGHDVLTAFEDGRANKSIQDNVVLIRAQKLKRSVLTINRRDFIELHSAGLEHEGIVVCTFDADFVGQANRIHEQCDAERDLKGKLVRVNRPG